MRLSGTASARPGRPARRRWWWFPCSRSSCVGGATLRSVVRAASPPVEHQCFGASQPQVVDVDFPTFVQRPNLLRTLDFESSILRLPGSRDRFRFVLGQRGARLRQCVRFRGRGGRHIVHVSCEDFARTLQFPVQDLRGAEHPFPVSVDQGDILSAGRRRPGSCDVDAAVIELYRQVRRARAGIQAPAQLFGEASTGLGGCRQFPSWIGGRQIDVEARRWPHRAARMVPPPSSYSGSVFRSRRSRSRRVSRTCRHSRPASSGSFRRSISVPRCTRPRLRSG